MYKLVNITVGKTLGYAENPKYIRWSIQNQCYVPSGARKAQGVVFNSEPYNLFPRTEFEGVDTVALQECDAGDEIFALITENEKLRADNEYLAMMTGIDIDEEEETAEEEPLDEQEV